MNKHFSLIVLIPLYFWWEMILSIVFSGAIDKATRNGWVNITFSTNPIGYFFVCVAYIGFGLLFSFPLILILRAAYAKN